MTVYQVHHSWTPGEDKAEVTFDELPLRVFRVWDNSGQEWRRIKVLWTAVGVSDTRVLWWHELLAEFGPVSDEPPKPWRCPICGPDGEGCAGHTRTAETALVPLSGAEVRS